MDNILSLMAAAARTAPKTEGFDDISIEVEDNSLFIGVNAAKNDHVNCGMCGAKNCREFKESEMKLNCVFKITDLGLAVSSALDTAKKNGIDAEIKFRKGHKLNDCTMVVEIKK